MSHKLKIKQVDLSGVTQDNSKTRFLVIDSSGNLSWNDSPSGGGGGSLDILEQGVLTVAAATSIDFNSGFSVTDNAGTAVINAVYNTQLDPTLSMPNSVGGIPAGTLASDLAGDTIVQILDDLFFPTVLPTYTVPTMVLSSSVTGSREIGSTMSSALSVVGTENDADQFTSLTIKRSLNSLTAVTLANTLSPLQSSVANVPDQFGYTNPNNPNYNYSLSHTDTGLVVPAPISGNNSTIVYSAIGDYSAGLAKLNNKGIADSRAAQIRSANAPQALDTNFAANSITILGYYPYFYGKTASSQTASQIKSIIESGSGYTKVVSFGSGGLSMSFNAVGEWPWFAIYSGYATKTTWYENALNSGLIGAPTDLFASPTTLSVTSPDGYWVVTYKIYPANKVTTLGTAIIS